MNIKQHRAQQAITLRELARRAGISCGHLSQIESGKIGLTAKTAKRLAKAMKIKQWWVLVTTDKE